MEPPQVGAVKAATECPDHGVRQVRVLWGESGSRFTALFEALVIHRLRGGLYCGRGAAAPAGLREAAGITSRVVHRGLVCREAKLPKRHGIDEVSFQRSHE